MKIIVINGRGSAGKDAVVECVRGLLKEKLMVWNISSVDPSKMAARAFGWDGDKTAKDRKFLADLKQLSIEYNDHPTKHITKEINEIIKFNTATKNSDDIVFVHIREPDEIQKIVNEFHYIHTLFIDRHKNELGNVSDDDVEDYEYDYVLDNTGKWEYTVNNIKKWLMEIGIEDKYIEQSNRGSRE